ncbi:hypothetical protein SKAU_G00014190 [Synaphobranchus kaupii]|uniref:Uncharacterized protein n=1 Tax=Synaphobranchus kaupii TaxID=118154 RepID=A0A9Q1GAK9_SYNKA|nr:hypothetical protein SKAU_G00014190 [Synaphobranchus kaupii]
MPFLSVPISPYTAYGVGGWPLAWKDLHVTPIHRPIKPKARLASRERPGKQNDAVRQFSQVGTAGPPCRCEGAWLITGEFTDADPTALPSGEGEGGDSLTARAAQSTCTETVQRKQAARRDRTRALLNG